MMSFSVVIFLFYRIFLITKIAIFKKIFDFAVMGITSAVHHDYRQHHGHHHHRCRRSSRLKPTLVRLKTAGQIGCPGEEGEAIETRRKGTGAQLDAEGGVIPVRIASQSDQRLLTLSEEKGIL